MTATQSRPVAVVAPTYIAFKDVCQARGLNPHMAIWASGPHRLRGYHSLRVIYAPESYRMPKIAEIAQQLAFIEATGGEVIEEPAP